MLNIHIHIYFVWWMVEIYIDKCDRNAPFIFVRCIECIFFSKFSYIINIMLLYFSYHQTFFFILLTTTRSIHNQRKKALNKKIKFEKWLNSLGATTKLYTSIRILIKISNLHQKISFVGIFCISGLILVQWVDQFRTNLWFITNMNMYCFL